VAPRLVVLGWDSATFDVVDPLLAEGRLPALAALGDGGFKAPLRSTWPPMTDCAWTSAFTGRNPGGHGIFGSWYRAPGSYGPRYFSSRDRRAPALWDLADGVRFLVWNVPMAFPPTEIDGVMVSGYGAPPGARFCSPDPVQDDLMRRWSSADLLDRAPHSTLEAFLDDLVRGLEAQAEALVWLADREDADCLIAVWPQVDRAQHFFWRFRGTEHPLAGAVETVYEAMDRATGRLMEAFDGADFMIVSDHGAGTLIADVNVGAWLASNGFATYGRNRTSLLLDLAWRMPPPVRRLGRRLWPGAARRAFGATLAGQLGPFDWSATSAFVGLHGDLWLNLDGREQAGRIAPADADEMLDEIAAGILSLEDPADGRRLFAAVHRRSAIYSGAAIDLAPDLMLDSWSAGYRVAPGREESDGIVIPPAPLAGVDAAWSSDHRPLGIFVAGGPRVARGTTAELSLYDICPTALALLERDVPEGLDGAVAEEALDRDFLAAHPIRMRSSVGQRPAGGDYSEDEAAAVAAHLKDLGYIE
jgi:predicted AlkP superfamily phosphohydrolase/phosphomutase